MSTSTTIDRRVAETARAAGRVELARQATLLRAGLAAALAAALAVFSASVMPRGPVDGTQGLAVIASCLAVGLAAGYLTRSRLSFPLIAVVYVAAYELSRAGIQGASLEQLRFDSGYAIVAVLTGRGLHALLALLPMGLGVAIGAGRARGPVQGASRRRFLAGAPRALLVLTVVGLSILVAWPASTPPVLGPDGRPIPGSIAELTAVELGGTRQAIQIRAADPDDPVLLYLAGGPGQSDLAMSRVLLEPLTHEFVVVGWDQRGTGKSYSALVPASSLTLEQVVDDTIQLAEYLRERFDEEAIYVLGESWGSTLGVLAAQRRPDLFHAFIGSGQMVSQYSTDTLLYEDLTVYAAEHDDEPLLAELAAIGKPPYRDKPWSNAFVMGYYDALAGDYDVPAATIERAEAAPVGPWGVLGSEYTLIEKANVLRGLIDTFSILYPQLAEVDFRTDVTSLDVPVYILDAGHELRARRELALEWFALLEAPIKRLVTFEDAGHSVAFEQTDAFLGLLSDEILPATYPSR